jgi:hypothetical protein
MKLLTVISLLYFATCVLSQKCFSIQRVDKCVGECKWQILKTCDYRKSPITCNVYEYGCQNESTYCDFNLGNANARKQQCQSKGAPCVWDKKKKKCGSTTLANN